MRVPVVLLACSLLGIIGGAFLIGRWAVGCAIIFAFLSLGAYAIWGYDDGQEPEPTAVTLAEDELPAENRAFIERVRPRKVS